MSIWFAVSFVVFVAGVVGALRVWRVSLRPRDPIIGSYDADDAACDHEAKSRKPRGRATAGLDSVQAFRLFMAATAVAIFFVVLPIADSQLHTWHNAVIGAVYGTAQVFTASADMTSAIKSYQSATTFVGQFEAAYTIFLFAIAPIMTVSLILTFLQTFVAPLRYFFAGRDDVYVFSELNERSIALATSINHHNLKDRKDGKGTAKACLVFTDVIMANNEPSIELISKARAIGAICFKDDILSLTLNRGHAKSNMWFFMMKDDETQNTVDSIDVLKAYQNRDKTNLYVFAHTIESELALRYHPGKIQVRRINPSRTLIYDWLWRPQLEVLPCDTAIRRPAGIDLFDDAVDAKPKGDKVISSVIIGLGDHGMQMLRALTWYCQMDSPTGVYQIKINGFDADPGAGKRLASDYPELANGVTRRAAFSQQHHRNDAVFDITIHPDMDATNPQLVEEVLKIDPVTFVFVCLGSDSLNLTVATKLRREFARVGRKTTILTISRHSDTIRYALQQESTAIAQSDLISKVQLIGDIQDLYSQDEIIQSDMENHGWVSHMYWQSTFDGGLSPANWQSALDLFWADEYSYNASVAVPIHLRARDALSVGPGSVEEEQGKRLEHARWNAFMRSEGFRASAKKDLTVARTHNLIEDYDPLPDREKKKDANSPHEVLRGFQSILDNHEVKSDDSRPDFGAIQKFVSDMRDQKKVGQPLFTIRTGGNASKIGVTGHRSLPESELPFLRRAISTFLQTQPYPLVVFSCLAAGADQIFADEALKLDADLTAVIPCGGYEGTMGHSTADYERLRDLASRREEFGDKFPKPSDQAYQQAGQTIVDECDVLLAVWDGKPGGPGGTASTVKYAMEAWAGNVHKKIIVLWSDGYAPISEQQRKMLREMKIED